MKNIFRSYPSTSSEISEKYTRTSYAFMTANIGYCACRTIITIRCITDAVLAMARLMDGYNSARKKIPVRAAKLGLMAAIFHDAGFIQSVHDLSGTGAKHTIHHVERSVHFVKTYFARNHFSKQDARSVANMILCTDMAVPVEKIKFGSPAERTAGLMLGAADLLGQMASRCYLERLLVLYREFREGRVKGYASELELLRKTLVFSKFIRKRLKATLENTAQYARLHFKRTYRINKDFYREATEKQLAYLKDTVLNHPEEYRKYLHRSR